MSEQTSMPEAGLMRETRLHERAAVLLAADVVGGRLAPDEPFPSAEELVQRFGFSRTVAREVLQTLSMLGLVRVAHGKRTEDGSYFIFIGADKAEKLRFAMNLKEGAT